MIKYWGNLLKMNAQLSELSVDYSLALSENNLLPMNPLIGKTLHWKFTGKIHCIHCGKITKKSYAQGHCYQCFITLPQTDKGIVSPEKDLSYLGISRDMEWSKKNSLIPHFVYLSLTDKVKVGVTRHTQIPTRWIDQGATQAIILAEAPNRHIAGVIEVFLKKYFADKTSWQAMLTQKAIPPIDLVKEKQQATNLLHPELKQYAAKNSEIQSIKYPIKKIPEKVKAVKPEAHPTFAKKLSGIKGQYLIFDDSSVLNIRNHSGYEVEITVE